MTEPRSIGLFLPNWIGDVVMATPAMRAIRNRYPNANLFAICKPYVAETIHGLPWFDGVWAWERSSRCSMVKSSWSLVRKLQAADVDTAVLFTNSLRPAVVARLAGCTQVIGFARYLRHLLLSKRLYAQRGSGGGYQPYPVILDYNRLAVALGTAEPGTRMQLATTTNDEALASQVLAGLSGRRPVVGFNPGGAFGSSKHWPNEAFAELAQKLIEQGNDIVVLCGPSERAQADRIVVQAARPGRILSVGAVGVPLSIGVSKALVRRLSLLITTDSGPRHFAAAFDVPVVTLFGPTHIGWTETYFEKAKHLQLNLPCGPCQQRLCPLGHHRCMKDLSPDMVLQPSLELLDRFKDEPRELGHYVARTITIAR